MDPCKWLLSFKHTEPASTTNVLKRETQAGGEKLRKSSWWSPSTRLLNTPPASSRLGVGRVGLPLWGWNTPPQPWRAAWGGGSGQLPILSTREAPACNTHERCLRPHGSSSTLSGCCSLPSCRGRCDAVTVCAQGRRVAELHFSSAWGWGELHPPESTCWCLDHPDPPFPHNVTLSWAVLLKCSSLGWSTAGIQYT